MSTATGLFTGGSRVFGFGSFRSRVFRILTMFVFVVGGCLVSAAVPVLAQQPTIQSVHKQAQVALHGPDGVGKDGPLSRLGSALSMLYFEHDAFAKSGKSGSFTSSIIGSDVSGEVVTVDATARGDAAALESALWQAGAERVTRYKHLVSARIPIDRIPDVAALSSLRSATLSVALTSRKAITSAELERRARLTRERLEVRAMTGATTSQGDEAMNSDDVRSTFGIDGAVVKVGSLSDSYDTNVSATTSAADDIASGDLPPANRIDIVDDGIARSDEGRAMMQLIHDVVPGAEQAFHTAFGGQADFAQGIIDLADAGSDVIVDDVGYLTEPFFQDGVIAQAVDEVASRGIPYFSSAGNAATNSYETDVMNFVVRSDGTTEAFDFDTSASVDTTQSFTLPVGFTANVGLQWDDPYFAASGDPGFAADTDIDFLVLDNAGNVVMSASSNNISSGDPAEFLGFFNDGSIDADGDGNADTEFQFVIVRQAGPQPGRIKYIQGGSATVNEHRTESSTSYGHSVATDGAGVAAAAWYDSPEFGVDPATPESFTSLGGATILFEATGPRLSLPEVRDQPRFTAPDGTNTTFFGGDIPQDGDSFPNFFGTSAAAPHAAAVAALQLQADPSLTPAQVYADLAAGARDMFDTSNPNLNPGYDFLSGAGFIDASQTITSITSEPRAQLRPETIDFGTRFIDTGSGTLYDPAVATVEFRNTGTADVTISSVSISGTAFQFQSGSEISTGVVPVGGSVSGIIEFAGSSAGTFSEALTINSDAANAASLTTTIDLIASEDLPVAGVSPTELFEAAEAGQIESEQVMVENTGASALTYDIFAEATGIGPFVPGDIAVPQTASASSKKGKVPAVDAMPVPAVPASKAAFDPLEFLYTLDDGTVEGTLGFDAGSADLGWFNILEVQDGATTITAIATRFAPTLPIGTPVDFVLYEDPNDDGDPGDAQLVASVSTTVEVTGAQFQTEPIAPTQVSGVFLIGVVAQDVSSAPQIDQSSTERSSLASRAASGTFDINNPPEFFLVDDLRPDGSLAGNFILRAQGSYVAFEPVSGTIPPGDTETVDITFDGTSLPVGIYSANAAVTSNDPITPKIDVPFDFFVADEVGEVADVSSDGMFLFGNSGVSANLSGVSGSGRVTAAFFNQSPSDLSGIDPGLNVGDYRWILVDEGNVSFSTASTLTFSRSVIAVPGFDPSNGDDVVVYARSPYNTGTFAAEATSFLDRGTPSDLSDDAIQVTGRTGFSEFVFTSDTAPLPVELSLFDVTPSEDGAVVRWETASETNNAGFRIEYQQETESSWTDAGVFVEGAGTTSQSTSYQETISGLSPNTYTFRLRQIDVDGTETPTAGKIITVRMDDVYSLTKMSPNPLTHTGTLKLSVRDTQPVTVSLYNVLGQKVKTLLSGPISGQSTETIRVDGSRLSSGIYFVRVVGERFQGTQKITVVR